MAAIRSDRFMSIPLRVETWPFEKSRQTLPENLNSCYGAWLVRNAEAAGMAMASWPSPKLIRGSSRPFPLWGREKEGKQKPAVREGRATAGAPCHSRECEKPDLASGPALSLLDSHLRGNGGKNRFAKRLSP